MSEASVIVVMGSQIKTPLIRRGFSFRRGRCGYFTLMFSADSLLCVPNIRFSMDA
jgi:hypothetical protein